MGWVDPIKRPDDLVRMIAALRQDVPARLALVGRATEEQRRELGSLAAELGCKDAVTITGFVSDAEYAAWLARATCVVLLRRGSHGEGSAAIADALMRGGQDRSGNINAVLKNVYTAFARARGTEGGFEKVGKLWGLAEWYPRKPKQNGPPTRFPAAS